MNTPERSVPQLLETDVIVVLSSGGGFWCSCRKSTSTDTGMDVIIFRGKTYLSADQVRDDQIEVARCY